MNNRRNTFLFPCHFRDPRQKRCFRMVFPLLSFRVRPWNPWLRPCMWPCIPYVHTCMSRWRFRPVLSWWSGQGAWRTLHNPSRAVWLPSLPRHRAFRFQRSCTSRPAVPAGTWPCMLRRWMKNPCIRRSFPFPQPPKCMTRKHILHNTRRPFLNLRCRNRARSVRISHFRPSSRVPSASP